MPTSKTPTVLPTTKAPTVQPTTIQPTTRPTARPTGIGLSADGTVVESDHNYSGGLNLYVPVSIPGAYGYEVRFDQRSAIETSCYGGCDYLNIYKDATHSTYWGSPYYAGLSTSGIWSSNYSLIIYNSSFIVHFATGGGDTAWGFKMYIIPLFNETLPLQAQLELDTPHPYYGGLNFYSTVAIPGAYGYKVRFDSRSALETSCYSGCDYLNLYKDATHSTYWGSPYYAGLSTSGIWSSNYSLIIYNSSFIVHFATGGGNTAWGFKMYITSLFNETLPVQEVLELDSPHSYWSGLSFYTTVAIPGAYGYKVKFDSRTATETSCYAGCDYLNLYKDATYSAYWGSPYYAGLVGSGMWSTADSDYSLIVYAPSFIVHFSSGGGDTAWGFKLYITPLMNETLPLQEVLELDSPHSYWGQINYYTTVDIPGAYGYKVRFDQRSAIETSCYAGCDYLNLYKDATHSTYWGSPYYAGLSTSGIWSSNY
eukprot:gene33346-41148_t